MVKGYPVPFNESFRLSVLNHYLPAIQKEQAKLDVIVRLAQEHFNVPTVLITLIEEARQWFPVRCGLDVEETERSMAFCAHALLSDEVLVVSDATTDPRFAENPLVTGPPHIRFYAGAPLRVPEGVILGTLCLIDSQPRDDFSPAEQQYLKDLAAMAIGHLVPHREKALERAALENRLLSLANEADAAKRAKSEFLALVGHELRTPLNPIIGFAELIARQAGNRGDGAASVEFAHQILASSQRLVRTVDRMLQFAQLESGMVDLQESEVDLHAALTELTGQMQGEALRAHVHLSLDDACKGWRLHADRLHFDHMVLEILSNAIANSPEDSTVGIRAERAADSFVITIEDNGLGLDPEYLENAMTAFSQADMSHGRPFEGIGLGLPLTKRLAELHGGGLALTERKAGGTRAELRFPLYRLAR